MSQQLPLPLQLRTSASFANFIAGPNREALSAVQALAGGRGESYLYLWGRASLGKTHLLQACCRAVNAGGQPVAYIPLSQAQTLDPRVVQDLDDMALVCLDDLDRVAGQPRWEGAIFTLYNRLREREIRLLITGDRPLASMRLDLPDLGSRLAWGPSYQIHPLDDEQLLEALTRLAGERGLELSQEIGRYLLRRCTRDMGFMQGVLEKLDRESLAAQRRLTIPFVREVLSDGGVPEI
jgi:DnaA family protein